MTRRRWYRSAVTVAVMVALAGGSSGCDLEDWHGLNSLPLPGTSGNGPGSFTIQAQMPDVNNIQPNSRVRVGDATVGHITKIELQGWHALVTMRLNGDVKIAGQRDGQDRPDQPPGLAAHRVGAHRQTRRRKAGCTTGR